MRVYLYSEAQLEKFGTILSQNPKLLCAHELVKISKPASFLSFIIKEIYDYANIKAQDGVSVSVLRKMKIKSEQYSAKIKELRELIL